MTVERHANAGAMGSRVSDKMSSPSEITGAILVGAESRRGEHTFTVVDPATGSRLSPAFQEAGAADVEAACGLAAAAFGPFSELALTERASFLECAATEITALGDALIERAMAETGLPRARLEGERQRTVGQLRFFADVVREGAWIDATIDPAKPARTPLPRPDLRRHLVAVGPVVVFGASIKQQTNTNTKKKTTTTQTTTEPSRRRD